MHVGLKCRFYDYSDMVRPTDQGMTSIENIVVILTSHKRKGNTTTPQGPHGEAPGSIRSQKKKETLLYFLQGETGETG